MTIDLSVVIPAYNEAERLASTLASVIGYLESRRLTWEVLVVDDGSEDATSREAEAFPSVRVVRLGENRGKGAACRRGVELSRGKLVLLTDADLSTPIEDLGKLEDRIGEAELVLGSRAVAGANVTRRQPLYRMLMGKSFNKIIRVLGVRGIHDTQCGFKLLEGAIARSLFADMVTNRYAFDVELVWLARRRGYRVVEVGVTWEDSPATRVSPITDPPQMIFDVLRFRWKHRRQH